MLELIKDVYLEKFYVYVHFRKDDHVPFYVGKGCKDRHLKAGGRSKNWNATVKKHGWYSEIVARFDDEQDAFDMEVQLIKLIGRADQNKGTLVNLSDGGKAPPSPLGKKLTPEQSAKRSANHYTKKPGYVPTKGWKRPDRKGKPLPKEWRENIGKGGLGKKHNMTEEGSAVLRASVVARKPRKGTGKKSCSN